MSIWRLLLKDLLFWGAQNLRAHFTGGLRNQQVLCRDRREPTAQESSTQPSSLLFWSRCWLGCLQSIICIWLGREMRCRQDRQVLCTQWCQAASPAAKQEVHKDQHRVCRIPKLPDADNR